MRPFLRITRYKKARNQDVSIKTVACPHSIVFFVSQARGTVSNWMFQFEGVLNSSASASASAVQVKVQVQVQSRPRSPQLCAKRKRYLSTMENRRQQPIMQRLSVQHYSTI